MHGCPNLDFFISLGSACGSSKRFTTESLLDSFMLSLLPCKAHQRFDILHRSPFWLDILAVAVVFGC